MLNCNPPGVVIPLEWCDMFEKMPAHQVQASLLAILTYAATGALPEFTDPTLDMIWPIFQARLDSDIARYRKKVERSRAYKEQQAAQADAPAPRKVSPSRSTCEAKTDKWL